ncbi:hypothetical protein BDZ97DRAFT_1760391 [Flammula alnicola]|nr:hypothetical protein BDZ97DRAFT_1760391 [Flammula alnicola]
MSTPLLVSEAKSIHQSLKELLKTKEPFDKEVDFQRKNLRRRYLNLLLVHPNAKESKDVENHLWMQTSYAFISSYKQRIAALDRAIQNNQRQQQNQGQQGPHPRQSNHGVVEHRKLVQRFRNFLADEEKFWTQLVLRLRRLFDLDEAQPALLALGLMTDADDVPATVSATEGAETRDGVMHGANGRNHFQFPPEDLTASFVPTTPEERESRLAILSKALICLGDIARYRELYNESGGKRAGQEDGGPGRRGRNRRGGAIDNPPRPRNYNKAQQCYEQARMLVPSEGNPSHQLAILASYKKDSFGSLIHYYRALCVSQPYDTAAENLGTVLTKALEMWRQKMRRERDRSTSNDAHPSLRLRIEAFQESVVVLHALWRVGMDKGVEKMKSISPKHNEKVANEFYALVSERHLPIDMISNTIVLSQGALWKHRMIRDTSSTSHSRNHQPTVVPPGTSTIIEWAMLDHLMDLHFALLEVGKDELKDPPTMDDLDDLAQRISATFRRTLPALRIASKWLRANFKYVVQDQEFIAFQAKEEARGLKVEKKSPNKISGYSAKTLRFWQAYARFILALSQAFPVTKLPVLSAPLEEDIEMRGFLPLRKLMGEVKKSDNGEKPANGVSAREQVHPNVEQLMRISDLLEDAKALAKMENSPLLLINNHIMFNLDVVEDVRPPSHTEMTTVAEDANVPIDQQELLATIRDTSLGLHPRRNPDDDDMTEFTSRTDDDPVGDAFKFLNTSEDVVDEDQQDDEIVWDPRASISPTLSPSLYATPLTPVKPMLSPKALSPRSPTHYLPAIPSTFSPLVAPPPAPATTAQDLLNDVMGFNGASRPLTGSLLPHIESISTAPQPKFLFGSELSHRPSQSIWSASRDEQPLMYTGNGGNAPGAHAGGHIYQTSPRQFSAALGTSQDLSQQSIWTSSYPSQSQNSQQNFVGALPSTPFAQPPQTTLSSTSVNQRQQHHHMPSSSVAAQLFPNHSQVQHDPFTYSSPIQPPIHRPKHNLSSPSSGYLNSPLPLGSLGGHGAPPTQYYTSAPSGYHSRQLSMHDPRVTPQSYMSPPMSQVWGNTG